MLIRCCFKPESIMLIAAHVFGSKANPGAFEIQWNQKVLMLKAVP